MQAFVPKNRKPKFDLTISIIDLTNIPLVVGHVYVKWHLPSSSSAEHRGKTDKARIKEHRATWEYVKSMPVRLTIDKNLALQQCEICFEILQEYHDGGRGGRVHLGNVRLNLAEYTNTIESTVEDPQEGDDGTITRRYLMQDSKVNATIKIGISMRQTDGDTNFVSPPLKSAMVIGGIADIMSTEAGGETDNMPSIASKSRELSEAQDIYRRNLAASWACERGEMRPDKLIEDLFAGGDGGKLNHPPALRRLAFGADPGSPRDESSNSSDADSRRGTITRSMLTPDMARPEYRHNSSHDRTNSTASLTSTVSGRGSIEQQMQQMHHTRNGHRSHRHQQQSRTKTEYHETTEFDLRDDLRSWQVHVA